MTFDPSIPLNILFIVVFCCLITYATSLLYIIYTYRHIELT